MKAPWLKIDTLKINGEKTTCQEKMPTQIIRSIPKPNFHFLCVLCQTSVFCVSKKIFVGITFYPSPEITNDLSWGGHGTSSDRPLRLLSAKPASLDQLALRANHRRVSAWRRCYADVIHYGPTRYVYRCSFSQDMLYIVSWRLFSKVPNEQPKHFFRCQKWSGLRQSY